MLKEYRSRSTISTRCLFYTLAERFRCTKAVGELKAANMICRRPIRRARKSRSERLRRLAKEADLDPDFAEKFLNFIIQEVIRHHERIAAENGKTDN